MRCVLLCFLLALLPTSLATTFRAMSPQELVAAADLVFTGTVRSSDPALVDGEPWTEVVFETELLLLDTEEPAAPDGTVTLRFLGGNLADSQLNVALMPQFTPGDQVLVFAYAEQFWSPVVGFNQGVWWLSPDGEWRDMTGTPLGVDESGNLERQPGSEATTVTDLLTELLESP